MSEQLSAGTLAEAICSCTGRHDPAWSIECAYAKTAAEKAMTLVSAHVAARLVAVRAEVVAVLDATEWDDWPGRHRLIPRLRAALSDDTGSER